MAPTAPAAAPLTAAHARAGAPARRRTLLSSLPLAALMLVALLAPHASALAPFVCPAADAPAPVACYVGWSGTYFTFSAESNGAPVAPVTNFSTPGLCVRRRWVCTAAVRGLVGLLNAQNFSGYVPPVPLCEVGARQTVYSFVNTSWCAQKQAWVAGAAAYVPPPGLENSDEAHYWQAQKVIADAVESYTFCDTPLCNTPEVGAGGAASSGAARGRGVASVWGGVSAVARTAAPLLLAAAAALGGGLGA
jgi:hypothetical protein